MTSHRTDQNRPSVIGRWTATLRCSLFIRPPRRRAGFPTLMAMAARRLVPFQLRPSAARPLATGAAAPHRRKHDVVSCKSTGKTKARIKAKDTSMWRPQRRELEEHLKRRTRSEGAFDADLYRRHSHSHHVPVLLGEVLAAYRRPLPLRSFVDCTLGAAGHSLAVRSPIMFPFTFLLLCA